MKYLKVIISLLFLCSSLYSAAETADSTKPDSWNDPWGDAIGKSIPYTADLRSDLIVKKSKERILCRIASGDSSGLVILVSDNGKDIDTVSVAASDIEYFQCDFNSRNYGSSAESKLTMGNARFKREPTAIGTLGFLQAGGVVGFDYEHKLFDHVGLQIGAGIVGADAALNFHFGKSIKSPYISFQARNQLVITYGWGVAYGHRFDSGFAFQAGVMTHAVSGSFGGAPIKPTTVQMLLVSVGKWFRL